MRRVSSLFFQILLPQKLPKSGAPAINIKQTILKQTLFSKRNERNLRHLVVVTGTYVKAGDDELNESGLIFFAPSAIIYFLCKNVWNDLVNGMSVSHAKLEKKEKLNEKNNYH